MLYLLAMHLIIRNCHEVTSQLQHFLTIAIHVIAQSTVLYFYVIVWLSTLLLFVTYAVPHNAGVYAIVGGVVGGLVALVLIVVPIIVIVLVMHFVCRRTAMPGRCMFVCAVNVEVDSHVYPNSNCCAATKTEASTTPIAR